MWNLFDRYRGNRVLPSARQMNLIADILNHVTQGTGMSMSLPSNPSMETPWIIGIDTAWLKEFVKSPALTPNSLIKSDADGNLAALCSLLLSAPTTDKVLTVKSGGTDVTWGDADDHDHVAEDITDWDDATSGFLTDNDIGTTVAEYNHTHPISDFTAPNCTADSNSPCFLLSDRENGIYHSNQDPSVATVRAMCTAWTNNGNSFGSPSSLDHTDISDWATATSDFLTSSSLSGYVTSGDLTSALSDYAFAQTVSDLADVVNAINDAYQDSSDVSSAITTALADYVSTSDLTTALADYVTTGDLGEYLEEGDFPTGFLASCASGYSGTETVVTAVEWNGTTLSCKTRTKNYAHGLVTSLGTETSTTIDTPTVITWR